MRRRKVLAGLGSLAAGGAAAMGTGAFTTGEVPRDAIIGVSNDDTDAKLGFTDKQEDLRGPGGRSPYATVSGGNLVLNFDDGSGMNTGSTYTFDAVFRIINQNTAGRTILVGLNVNDLLTPTEILDVDVTTHSGGVDLRNTLDFSTDPPSKNNVLSPAILDPGESLDVDFRFEVNTNSNVSTAYDDTREIEIGGVDIDSP